MIDLSSFSQYGFNELYNVPAQPGLYAWFAAPTRRTDLRDYQMLFRDKSFNSFIYGNMTERYKGIMEPFDIGDFNVNDQNSLIKAALAFAPPIYIGISGNLHRRLKTHADHLAEMLLRPPRQNNDMVEAASEKDTDAESASFAARVSAFARTRSLDATAFYVRIVVFQEDYPRHYLLQVETYLNRTYLPLFGLQ